MMVVGTAMLFGGLGKFALDAEHGWGFDYQAHSARMKTKSKRTIAIGRS